MCLSPVCVRCRGVHGADPRDGREGRAGGRGQQLRASSALKGELQRVPLLCDDELSHRLLFRRVCEWLCRRQLYDLEQEHLDRIKSVSALPLRLS